jgi:hypothetical protein
MASEYLPEFKVEDSKLPLANSTGPAEKKITDDGLTKSELSQLVYREIKGIIKSIKDSLIVNNLDHDLIHFFCTVHTIYNDLLQIRKNYEGGDKAFFESNEILFLVYYITVVRLLNEIKNSKINENHKNSISKVAGHILVEIMYSEFYEPELEKKNIKKTAITEALLKKVDKNILEDDKLITLEGKVKSDFEEYNRKLKELLAKTKAEAEADTKAEVDKYKADVNEMTPEERATELDRINNDENGKKNLELVIARAYVPQVKSPFNAGRAEPTQGEKYAAEAAEEKLDLAIKKQKIIEEAVQADIDELASRTEKIDVTTNELHLIVDDNNIVLHVGSNSPLKSSEIKQGDKVIAINNIDLKDNEKYNDKINNVMTDHNRKESTYRKYRHTITVRHQKPEPTPEQIKDYNKQAYTIYKPKLDEYTIQLHTIKEKADKAYEKAYTYKDKTREKVYEDELKIYKGLAQDVLDTMDKNDKVLKNEVEAILKDNVTIFKKIINDLVIAHREEARPEIAAAAAAASAATDASAAADAAAASAKPAAEALKQKQVQGPRPSIPQQAAAAAITALTPATPAASVTPAAPVAPAAPKVPSEAAKAAAAIAKAARKKVVENELKTKTVGGEKKTYDTKEPLDNPTSNPVVKNANNAIDAIIEAELDEYEKKYKESYDTPRVIKQMFGSDKPQGKVESEKYASKDAIIAGINKRIDAITQRKIAVIKLISKNKDNAKPLKQTDKSQYKNLININTFLQEELQTLGLLIEKSNKILEDSKSTTIGKSILSSLRPSPQIKPTTVPIYPTSGPPSTDSVEDTPIEKAEKDLQNAYTELKSKLDQNPQPTIRSDPQGFNYILIAKQNAWTAKKAYEDVFGSKITLSGAYPNFKTNLVNGNTSKTAYEYIINNVRKGFLGAYGGGSRKRNRSTPKKRTRKQYRKN